MKKKPQSQEIRSDSDPREISEKSGIKQTIWRLVKGPLYVAFLVISVLGLVYAMEKMAKYILSRSHLTQIYPQNLAMARKDYTMPVSHYDYDFVPGVCVEYNIIKGNRYEYANNAGFREPRPISKQKPENEYRIFLTGGSTAYGMGAIGEGAAQMGYYGLEYRETISHFLEMILNSTAPIEGKVIRVYNTGVWGYSYQHLLMRYIAKLRQYKPDMIISLDGANEIPVISKIDPDWNYFQEGQFHNILKEIYSYNVPGLTSYLTLWLKNNTFLMTYLWSGRDVFQDLTKEVHRQTSSSNQFPVSGESSNISLEEKSQIVDRNISDVIKVVENYHSVLENDGVSHIFAAQPWFYLSKKKHHEKENILEGMEGYRYYYGVPSDKMYSLLLNNLTQSAQKQGYFFVDFSDYFDDVSEWVFTDWCHLTAGANYLLAKELANLVKQHFFDRQLTASDRIEEKDSYFWDLAASATLVYSPPPSDQSRSANHIFRGYPGESFYSSEANSENKSEIIIDLGRQMAASRLRLVWYDRNSIPDKWTIEYSDDMKSWNSFIVSDNQNTDDYSRWPGFEYYSPNPVQARYFKYRPIDSDRQEMKLRLWSMFR